METYKATGAGAGGFVERSREEIINSWNEQLTTPIRGAVIDQQREILEMDWKERAAMWGGA
jgi:hypothetical protein